MTRRPAGFTLIEMVVVVAIVSILAMAALPLQELALRRAREQALREALRELRTAIDDYKRAADDGRIAKAAGASGYPPDLQALVAGMPLLRAPPPAASAPARPGGVRRVYFLRRLPRDPFADPALPAAQTWALRASDSPPDAPLPGADVYDVSSRSEAIAIDGSRYREW